MWHPKFSPVRLPMHNTHHFAVFNGIPFTSPKYKINQKRARLPHLPFFYVPAQESMVLSSVGYDCKQCCHEE
jgi:hypothetical protein